MNGIKRRDFVDRFMNVFVAGQWADRTIEGKASRAQLVGEIGAVASELAGPEPTPAVASLAESAAMAWFILRYSEASVSLAHPATVAAAKVLRTERTLDRATRRYLGLMKALTAAQSLGRTHPPAVG